MTITVGAIRQGSFGEAWPFRDWSRTISCLKSQAIQWNWIGAFIIIWCHQRLRKIFDKVKRKLGATPMKTLARIARSDPFLTFIRCISPTVKNPGNAVATQEEHQATFFAGKWITPGTRYGLKWNSLGVDLVTGTESLGRTEVTTLDIVMAIFQKVMNSSNHLMASNSAIGRRLHNVRSCLLRRSEHFLAIDNHFIWLLMIQKWTDTAFACSRSAIWSDNLFGMSHRCW